MFAWKMACNSITRRRSQSIAILLVSIALTLFLTLYSAGVDQRLAALADIHENIEVTARFSDSFCRVVSGLRLEGRHIELVKGSGFVKKEYYTRSLAYQFDPWSDNDRFPAGCSLLMAVNDIEAVSTELTGPRFTYIPGYNGDLFAGEEPVCLVSSSLNLPPGTEVVFTVFEQVPANYNRIRHGVITLKVVGNYASHYDTTIYCPWAVMKEVYSQLGLHPTWDSASYILQNTANLYQLRNLLKNAGINSPDLPAASIKPHLPGFIIEDSILKKASSSIQKYVDFMQSLYPAIYLLCAGIGFVVSYLVIRLRKPELAVMRSLGTSRSRAFNTLFLEQTLLAWTGVALGITLTWLLAGPLALLQIISALIYGLSYGLGSAIAILMINRTDVVQILSVKE